MGELKVIGHYVDTSGEFSDIYEGDRVKITRKASLEAMRKIKEQQKATCDPLDFSDFVKANTVELKLLLPTLKTAERAVLASITPYINYESNLLTYGKNNDVDTEELIEISGISRATGYKVINSLIKKHILYRGYNGRNVQYFICPWLYARGNVRNKTLKGMFSNYVILSKNGVAWYMLKD